MVGSRDSRKAMVTVVCYNGRGESETRECGEGEWRGEGGEGDGVLMEEVNEDGAS